MKKTLLVALSFIVFIILSLVWLVFIIQVFGAINQPFVNILDPSSSAGLDFPSGANSWRDLVILLSIPRIIYSVLFALGVVYLFAKFAKRVFNKLLPLKYWVLLLVMISAMFFAFIFPKKIFSIHLPPPPQTYKVVYQYNIGAACFDACDHTSVHFFTGASYEEIASFYESSSLFQKINLGYYEPIRPGEWFDLRLKNGKFVSAFLEIGRTTYVLISKP